MTFITLVPKCESPERVEDFRPISLCNVIMKVVTRCITNRMSRVMSYLVGDYQNAFVAGRHIGDNVLLAHEAIQNINKHSSGACGRFAFKADMSKAYDPEANRSIYGIKLSRNAPSLSHLLFADDSIFFLQDKEEAFSKLKLILANFCSASGQIMNESKSGILFSPSTTMRSVREGLRVLHISENKGIGRYLGIDTDFGSSKKEIFNALIEKVRRRISSWNAIFLSPAGRLTLISSVLSALSNYVLSVFKIPSCSYQTWGCKSLSFGMELLLAHLGWKPGVNSMLRIWKCGWVGGEVPPQKTRLGFPPPDSMSNFTVKDLLTPSLCWNHELIFDLFEPEWARRICAMPICKTVVDDCFFWKLTSSGIYSVKSGYAVCLASYLRVHSSSKDESRIDASTKAFCKKRLWRLPGPHVWKILVWRILTDSLSVGAEFVKRNLIIGSVCPWCGEDGKSFSPEYFFAFLSNSTNVALEAESRLASAVSALGAVFYDPLGTLRNEISNHFPFFLVGEKGTYAPFRVKVDASWVSSFHASAGWIVYAPNGECYGTFAISFDAESALQAEAIGIREALRWAARSNLLHLDLSSDCLQLLLQLARVESLHHLVKGILLDIESDLLLFHCICFSFVPRHLNKVAHNLARAKLGL
ncbi:uncharacterized protein LOC141589873 [Silene latifolia]|uniref:uncharacterized protein LOC141589873 n=1 Tax=Silene latifolia TaxID=37657 RepID=UPI003D77EE01